MDRVQTFLLFFYSSLVTELISSNGAVMNPCTADSPDTDPLVSLLSNIPMYSTHHPLGREDSVAVGYISTVREGER